MPQHAGGHPERLPLGLLAQRNWIRDDETFGALLSHNKRAINDKESIKWLESVAALAVAREAVPHTTFISVGDREADVYELFATERAAGVELLVRSSWNRGGRQCSPVSAGDIAGRPRVGDRRSGVPRRPAEPVRRCTLALRSMPITLKPPQARKRLGAVNVWAILAIEAAPPLEGEAIEWLLLTAVPAPSLIDAIERVHWYTCRWTIEVWHRVLKTGCRIESRQLETVGRLAIALTLYSIIAWCILYATMLARTDPDLSCTVVLSKEEWQALYCNIKRVPEPTATPPTLAEVVLWRGFRHLPYITDMFLIMQRNE